MDYFLYDDGTLRVNKASDWLHKRKTHIQLLLNCRSKLIVLEWVLTSQLRFHDSAIKRALTGDAKKGLRARNVWMSVRVCMCACFWKSSSLFNLRFGYLQIHQHLLLRDLFLPPSPAQKHVHISSNPFISSFWLVEISADPGIITWIMWHWHDQVEYSKKK